MASSCSIIRDVMASPECHFRVYDDVIWAGRYVFVERTVDYALVGDHDWLEIMFLPFAVPVFPLYGVGAG